MSIFSPHRLIFDLGPSVGFEDEVCSVYRKQFVGPDAAVGGGEVERFLVENIPARLEREPAPHAADLDRRDDVGDHKLVPEFVDAAIPLDEGNAVFLQDLFAFGPEFVDAGGVAVIGGPLLLLGLAQIFGCGERVDAVAKSALL